MSLKKLKSFGIVGLFASAGYGADGFCAGWDAGFEAGFCYQKYSCLAPLAPLCPLQSLRDANGYPGGYNRGFVAGQSKRAEKDAPVASYSAPAPSYRRDPGHFTEEMNQSLRGFAEIGQAIGDYRARKQAEQFAESQRINDSLHRVLLQMEIERYRPSKPKEEEEDSAEDTTITFTIGRPENKNKDSATTQEEIEIEKNHPGFLEWERNRRQRP